MNTIALLQFANNHPRGEGAEQRAVRAAGGQIALAGGDVLLAGVVIAGAKAHHQKCFFSYPLPQVADSQRVSRAVKSAPALQ